MTTANTVDANPSRKIEWLIINWEQVETTVRRLQARIVKALKENALRQVKNLQRLLTRSRSARLLAVKRVTTNKGRKTAGVDGKIWTTPEQKLQAVEELVKDILINGKANPYDEDWQSYFEKRGQRDSVPCAV